MTALYLPHVKDLTNKDEGEFLLERISKAQKYAKLAVELDCKQDYANAILNYKDCVEILETAVIATPEENQQDMFDLAKQYRARIELLEQSLPSLSGLIKIQPEKNFADFKEESPIGPIPERPPSSPLFRPFWLMRIIRKTIQSGGYLTPTIYVPKNVWYQPGAKFSAINTKIASCETINETILKLKEFWMEDSEVIAKELELFCSQLTQLQNSLAKVLLFIDEYKEEKGKEKSDIVSTLRKMGGAVAKNVVVRVKGSAKLDDTSSYLNLLSDVFENSEFLEKWLEHYMNTQPSSGITARLKRISDFLLTVLCAFVVKDLNSLIERYMIRALENFNRGLK